LPPPAAIADTDWALAQAVVARDRKAIAEFVMLCSDPLYRYVRSRLQPRFEFVDDLVQDVFLTAWRSLPNYRGQSPLKSWILGIARHKVEDHYRDRLRDLALPDDATETIPEPAPGADSVLEKARSAAATAAILDALPEPYRVVLLWRYWEQRSAEEMAALTGKTPKAIERLLSRARHEFRQQWLSQSQEVAR
jgi:RNA polymerase sigma-70 factor (ECF subfamily)